MNEEDRKKENTDEESDPNASNKGIAHGHKIKWAWSYWSESAIAILLLTGAGLFVPLIGDFMTKPAKIYCIGAGIWMIAGAVIFFICHSIATSIVRDEASPQNQTAPARPAAMKIQLPETLKATFRQLRNSFESLALKSNGLYHVLEERQQGVGVPRPTPDDCIPPGLSQNPNHPNTILSLGGAPGEPLRPVALSEKEISSVGPAKDSDWIIRDAQGRALAKWVPAIIRTGYIYGDGNILQPFHNLATAAGNGLCGIPDEVVASLPESIGLLCRTHETLARLYPFGNVPDNERQWVQQNTWQPIIRTFENGALVQHLEHATGGTPSETWALLLHRLGWEPQPGFSYCATKRYWRGSTSWTIRFADDFPQGPGVKDIPRHRTYSTLGSNSGTDTDVCWASVWALDRLLSLMDAA